MRYGTTSISVRGGAAVAALFLSFASMHAAPQAVPPAVPVGSASQAPAPAGAVLATGADYVIGPEDVLTIMFWRDKEVSGDYAVRPDGKISVPLINELQAAGLTPEQLRVKLTEARRKFEEDPTVSVGVKQINSRKVYITGSVGKPGAYTLVESITVVQLISKAGGLAEYTDRKNIVVLRKGPDGKDQFFKVNYDDLSKAKNLKQNIELKPGDTVMVR